MSELVELASVLGIKIDVHTTKLFLFDVVDGNFHLLATSEADTTNKPPYNDIREGFYKAIDNLQQISGRMLIDDDMNLIVPNQTDGSGIDQIAFTYGFLDQISIITAGLLEGVSISSLSNLINSTHLKHSDQISLNDSRKIDEILSSVINHRPDIILLSGGTENGANKSVLRMMEIILFCIKHLPKERIPELVYAGNSSIAAKIQETASSIAKISITENIRPTLADENLTPALTFINELSSQMMIKKVPGFEYIFSFTRSVPLPYNQANGIMTNFLNKLGNEKNGNILVIDLSKEIILMAGSINGNLQQNVVENPLFNNPDHFIAETNIREISKWLPINKEKEDINDYVWGKSIRPNTIPNDKDELLIEISIIKNLIRKNYHLFKNKFGNSTDNWNQIRSEEHT
ncbi:MAG: glutamate mutase L, partial [Anaerolineaceae bacterium]|nr:glutamate mutase L [Anaerolineaceae bacterium]